MNNKVLKITITIMLITVVVALLLISFVPLMH